MTEFLQLSLPGVEAVITLQFYPILLIFGGTIFQETWNKTHVHSPPHFHKCALVECHMVQFFPLLFCFVQCLNVTCGIVVITGIARGPGCRCSCGTKRRFSSW